MVDEPALLERGVLTAPMEAWNLAVRRAEVIGRLAAGRTVGHAAADSAAAELGVPRRQVYAMLARWRTGSGLASDLISGRSSGGRGRELLPEPVETVMREVLRSKYVSRQRRSLAAVYREVVRRCRAQGLRVPSRGTLTRRATRLDPVATTTARQGPDAARALQEAGGEPPPATAILQQVQMDHTPVDLIVVDDRHRLPIGRPYPKPTPARTTVARSK
ncbi:helix-turn-helix domain-containing protein [Actinoplanes sp. NEAU-A12]|uniref:Helix-turn-helix domain-containing protein n=1 Tax=Actinoplanes sandaracinus TaxID=3045177 RepID=A0ABT6WP86_9ACTN|nr:DNA-binding domain-containing protein [Actinoplanes sandaracinus]MDI6101544.1 helix-turn-helix domain-containing protein [Actinoplanes sandaracinus]